MACLPGTTPTQELLDRGEHAIFHANLLAHCSAWAGFFTPPNGAQGMQLQLGYDSSEAARIIDMTRGSLAAGMSTFVGLRPGLMRGFVVSTALPWVDTKSWSTTPEKLLHA